MEHTVTDINQLIADVKKQKTHFVIITGGVCSSIGKGVLTSSIGVLLKDSNFSISVMKCDPYLNVDPGTMSPLEHGEVFVTHDGAETDLDLGHYERMIDIGLTRESSVSSGQIFQEILDGERSGKFLGKCIQLVPHAVNSIKRRLLSFALKAKTDFVLIEIGGTVGDIEGEIFLEAIRQLRSDLSSKFMMHCHLSYVPYLEWANEVKTKPTQHSVMLLKKAGLFADALFLRTDHQMPTESYKKVSVMCGVKENKVFQILTHSPIYQLFVDLSHQNLTERICEQFTIPLQKTPELNNWKKLIERIKEPKESIKIGLIVKYTGSNDPYISIIEAIKAASYEQKKNAEIIQINARALEANSSQLEYKKAFKLLQSVDGILVPGGFDKGGMEGKMVAAQWARENNIPYLGICLGMQLMLVEAARNLAHIPDASSAELNPLSKNHIIALIDEQQNIVQKGGTMRLGSYPCTLVRGTKAHDAYGSDMIHERHRHRYEFNNTYKKKLEDAGIIFSGINHDQNLVEIVEIKDHPFMVGAQFHPEFTSRPLRPHPLFLEFIKSIMK